MKRLRQLILASITLFAITACMASAAGAATAPFFSIGGSRLAAGSTHNFVASAKKAFELSTPSLGVKIKCPTLTVEKGVLLGSNEGQPGKDNEIAKISGGCTTEGAGEGCKVNEPITTNQLISELVETSKGGKLVLAEELKPASGSTFVVLHFTGANCVVPETSVTGSMTAEVLTDPGGANIELGQAAKEASSWLINFPATPIEKILLVNTKGTVETVKTELQAFGATSVETGEALTLLANTKFEPEKECVWGPVA